MLVCEKCALRRSGLQSVKNIPLLRCCATRRCATSCAAWHTTLRLSLLTRAAAPAAVRERHRQHPKGPLVHVRLQFRAGGELVRASDTDRDRQTDKDTQRAARLLRDSSHLRRHNGAPWRHHTARPTSSTTPYPRAPTAYPTYFRLQLRGRAWSLYPRHRLLFSDLFGSDQGRDRLGMGPRRH